MRNVPRTHTPVLASLCGLVASLVTPTGTIAQPADAPVITLSPFEVVTKGDPAYTPQQATTGTLIAVDRALVPFQTSIITADLIADAGIDTPADIAEFLPGVSRSLSPYNVDEGGVTALSFRVRGFSVQPLYNGFQTGGRIVGLDSIGRIEVTKGPNAVLYGQAPAGGSVNFVPKGAYREAQGKVSAGFGANAYATAGAEFGGPLADGNANSLSVLFGAIAETRERDQTFFEADVGNLYGAVAWRPKARVQLDAQAEYITLDTVPSRTFAFVSATSPRVTDPLNRLRKDRNFSYNGPHSRNEQRTLLSTAYLSVFIGDKLTLRLGGFYSTQEKASVALREAFALSVLESFDARYMKDDDHDRTRSYKIDLLHEAELRTWRFNTLLGFQAHYQDNHLTSFRTGPDYRVTIPFSRRQTAADFPPLDPRDVFDDAFRSEVSDLEWTNLRLTQFASTPDSRTSVMWGVAYGEGESATVNRLSGARGKAEGDGVTYTAGATHVLLASDTLNVRAFANYSTSFQIQNGNSQNPASFLGFSTVAELKAFAESRPINPIDPQEGKGYEVGVRLDLPRRNASLTVGWYDQTRENIGRPFRVRESFVAGNQSESVIANFLLPAGEERARGVEIAFNWRPIPSLHLLAEANIGDGEVTAAPDEPGEVGLGLVNSPETMYSFWAKYDLPKDSAVGGLSVGLGATYNSSTRVQNGFNDRFRFSDDYVSSRAMLSYSFGAEQRNSVSLNVINVLDDDYVQEDNILSEPRLWRLTFKRAF